MALRVWMLREVTAATLLSFVIGNMSFRSFASHLVVVLNSYAANVQSRDGYVITFPHATPPQLQVFIQSAAPGDWSDWLFVSTHSVLPQGLAGDSVSANNFCGDLWPFQPAAFPSEFNHAAFGQHVFLRLNRAPAVHQD